MFQLFLFTYEIRNVPFELNDYYLVILLLFIAIEQLGIYFGLLLLLTGNHVLPVHCFYCLSGFCFRNSRLRVSIHIVDVGFHCRAVAERKVSFGWKFGLLLVLLPRIPQSSVDLSWNRLNQYLRCTRPKFRSNW